MLIIEQLTNKGGLTRFFEATQQALLGGPTNLSILGALDTLLDVAQTRLGMHLNDEALKAQTEAMMGLRFLDLPPTDGGLVEVMQRLNQVSFVPS